MTRRFVALAAALTTVAAGGVLLANASVTITPATFKMVALDGGGSIPVTGPVIRVPYDTTQRRYLAIDEQPLKLPVVISAVCGSDSFDGLSLSVAGAELPVSTIGLGKGGGGFSGRKTVTTNQVTTRALDNQSVPNPVSTCNADLGALVDAKQYGKAQKGWARKYDNALPATLSLRCKGPTRKKGGFTEPGALHVAEATTRFPVWIHCGPAAVFKPSPKSTPPAKKSSDVKKKSEPQRVASKPQRVDGPAPGAGMAAAMAPDLVILDVREAPTAPSKLRVQIANKGSAASPATKLTLFYERSGEIMKVLSDVPALAVGEARWTIVDAGSPLAYASHVTLRVDDPAGVPELDEGNNAFTVK